MIGRPVAGMEAQVADRRGAPVSPGDAGELCLSGSGLARGYLNRPAETAARFLPHPSSGLAGDRWYRTGDRVRCHGEDAGRRYEYLGRIDLQVKIRGFRVELGEIEAHLRRHPAVLEACAMVDEEGPRRLVAAARGAGEAPSQEEIRRFLGTSLPEHMVPTHVAFVTPFPTNTNGKVDRPALLERVRAALPSDRGDYRAPSTDGERLLCEVWCELFQREEGERIGVEENFFDLGGDSIVAIQLVSRARKRGLALASPQIVFRHQTIRELAATAPPPTPAEGPAEPAPRDPGPSPVRGAVLLTPVQAEFFSAPGPYGFFNQSVLLEVPADLEEEALRRALGTLVPAPRLPPPGLLPPRRRLAPALRRGGAGVRRPRGPRPRKRRRGPRGGGLAVGDGPCLRGRPGRPRPGPAAADPRRPLPPGPTTAPTERPPPAGDPPPGGGRGLLADPVGGPAPVLRGPPRRPARPATGQDRLLSGLGGPPGRPRRPTGGPGAGPGLAPDPRFGGPPPPRLGRPAPRTRAPSPRRARCGWPSAGRRPEGSSSRGRGSTGRRSTTCC